MNKKVVGIFVCSLGLGLVLGFLLPYLFVKPTIYDKLRASQIYFHRASLSEDTLQRAKYLERIIYFEWFKQIYDEKDSSRGTYDAIYVSVDVNWNVVWMELWLDNNPINLEYLGFYIYSETYTD